MLQVIASFIGGLMTIIIMDSIWLGYVVKGLIIREFGNLIELLPNGSIKFSIPIGLLAWSVIVLGVIFFASSRANSPLSALYLGSIFGGISYAIYDLTNLTFIKGYSPLFTAMDISWGIVLCAVVSLVCYSISKAF